MLAPSPRAVSGAASHLIFVLTAVARLASVSTAACATTPIHDFAGARSGA